MDGDMGRVANPRDGEKQNSEHAELEIQSQHVPWSSTDAGFRWSQADDKQAVGDSMTVWLGTSEIKSQLQLQ